MTRWRTSQLDRVIVGSSGQDTLAPSPCEAANLDLVSCVNVASDASQHVPLGASSPLWLWVGQRPSSSPRCGDGSSAQSGKTQPSSSLAEAQHWAEQPGALDPLATVKGIKYDSR